MDGHGGGPSPEPELSGSLLGGAPLDRAASEHAPEVSGRGRGAEKG